MAQGHVPVRKKSFHTVAKLFRAAAEAETHEYRSMYPGFVEEAKNENETSAVIKTWGTVLTILISPPLPILI
jgi:rubrerythrin